MRESAFLGWQVCCWSTCGRSAFLGWQVWRWSTCWRCAERKERCAGSALLERCSFRPFASSTSSVTSASAAPSASEGKSTARFARLIGLLSTDGSRLPLAASTALDSSSPAASRRASSSRIHTCCSAWSSFCFLASSTFCTRADSVALRASSLACAAPLGRRSEEQEEGHTPAPGADAMRLRQAAQAVANRWW